MEEEELQLKKQLRAAKAEELARRKKKRTSPDAGTVDKKPPPNCAIYVSNLPLENVNESDLFDEFSRFGIIRKDPVTDHPKCKLYVDDQGNLKGDALIVYLKPESVKMAVEFMDGAKFKGTELKVEEATFKPETKNEDWAEEETTEVKKLKLRKLQEQKNELNDWSDEVEEEEEVKNDEHSELTNGSTPQESEDKSARTTVLSNVLDLYARLSPSEISDIALDLKEGCEAQGEVVGFELDEVLGQARVEFATEEHAQRCCKTMDGRFFDGRKLMAYTLDKESKDDDIDIQEL
ncbi:LAFA_0C01442g1_1 [Lachancea sp. 'fantastica']|nr:LAFA_0C01442g1_1 [Lachancea sp. 'fantastica']